MFKDLWKDKDRRRGFIGTVVFHLSLLLVFLFFGLEYYEPKPEDGILINFGYAEEGLGNTAQVESSTAGAPKSEASTEKVNSRTQDIVDAPSLPTAEKNTRKEENNPDPKENPNTEETSQNNPQPSESLQKLLEKTKNSQAGGEGVTSGSGDQGSEEGDPNSSNRQGSGTSGSGSGNYRLGNRAATAKPKPDYPCSDQGRVVVKIYVNRNGSVIRAIPGDRIPGGAASTTTSSCLFQQAKKAALSTTWEGDPSAPEQQVGYIIYNFVKQ